MDKKKFESLLFYLIFMKAVSETLKSTYNINLEQLKVLNEIIKYVQKQNCGIYIEDLISLCPISKRRMRHHLEHLYHMGWIEKLRDDKDQRKVLHSPSKLYHEKLDILFQEIEEVLKLKYLRYDMNFNHLMELSYVIVLYNALNHVKRVAKQYDLNLDELIILGKIFTQTKVVSLKSMHAISQHYLICINSVINDLHQKGYIHKYRNPNDERLVNIKLIESRALETKSIFVQCYNKLEAEMKRNQ